jgi:hypothetical protein
MEACPTWTADTPARASRRLPDFSTFPPRCHPPAQKKTASQPFPPPEKFCNVSNKRLDIVVYAVKVWRMFSVYTTKQANRHQRRAASSRAQTTRRALLVMVSRTCALSGMKHSEAPGLPLLTLKRSPVVMLSETKHLPCETRCSSRSNRNASSVSQILRSAQDDKKLSDQDDANRLGGNRTGKSEEDQE